MPKALKINPADNVAIALADLKAGEFIYDLKISIKSDIPFGHKIALSDIDKGAQVIKYGYRIGLAKEFIPKGFLVNELNLKSALDACEEYIYSPTPNPEQGSAPTTQTNTSFMGFKRPSGEFGIRNEIWIIPLVSCVNCLAQEIAKIFSESEYAKATDGVFALPHAYGCSQVGCDHENTRKILADLCLNPNAGGVLVLGLGCENNNMEKFMELFKNRDTSRIRFLEAQNTKDEVGEALDILRELAEKMRGDRRESAPLSKLRIGLKCGGSDAFSGISANFLVGKFSDMAVARGASCALCEVPEMFGAETILMNRAETREIFEKIRDMINSFKNYFISHNTPVYENPSPGNKKGGISTLEEKSLGCVQKGGTSLVRDVLRYGERIKKSGLSLLESPGNDPVACTALAAAGCQIILFTTGRGTPFASAVPTVKISSNTPIFEKKPQWIDFNAGEIVNGADAEKLGAEFFDFVLKIANGKKTKSEAKAYKEIAIFKSGVTL